MKNSGREKYLKGARKYQHVLNYGPTFKNPKKRGVKGKEKAHHHYKANIEQETIAHPTK